MGWAPTCVDPQGFEILRTRRLLRSCRIVHFYSYNKLPCIHLKELAVWWSNKSTATYSSSEQAGRSKILTRKGCRANGILESLQPYASREIRMTFRSCLMAASQLIDASCLFAEILTVARSVLRVSRCDVGASMGRLEVHGNC